MRQRYPNTIRNKRQLNAVLDGSRNLLKSIYASIYFPTFTNGLKDVASYLGFNWSDPTLTGSRAAVFRRQWEIEPSEATKGMLVRYNIEDRRAAQIVADAVGWFSTSSSTRRLFNAEPRAHRDLLKVPYQRTYGPFASPSPDFHRINKAAYWNYQRERSAWVYVPWSHYDFCGMRFLTAVILPNGRRSWSAPSARADGRAKS